MAQGRADVFQLGQVKGKLEVPFIPSSLYFFHVCGCPKPLDCSFPPPPPDKSLQACSILKCSSPVSHPQATNSCQSLRCSRVILCPSLYQFFWQAPGNMDGVKWSEAFLHSHREGAQRCNGRWGPRVTPLRGFISYNKHNVNRFLGMMGLNPNQQQPNILARIGPGIVKSSPVLPVPQKELW